MAKLAVLKVLPTPTVTALKEGELKIGEASIISNGKLISSKAGIV